MFYKKLFFLLALFICFSTNTSDGGKPSRFKVGIVSLGFGLACAGVCYTVGFKLDIPDLLKTFSAYCLSVGSFVVPTAVIYQVGKRGDISYLTAYLKKGENRPNVSFIGIKEGQRFKLKIGADLFVWAPSLFVSIGVWKFLPSFAQYNKEWAAATIMLGQLVVNVWAQQTVLPARYNPFVWTNEQGKSESVLIFPSK